jgi:hypothetical protein
MLQSLNINKRYLVHQYKLPDIDIKNIDFQFVPIRLLFRAEVGCANN